MIKNIYFYRHGETNWNVLSLVMGQLENLDTKFTPLGIKQINNISKDLEKNSAEIIYCSDFKRAYETAKLASQGKIDIIKTKELRGLNMGQHQGELFINYINSPDVKEALSNHNIAISGGESINCLNKRIYNFVLDVCQNSKYESIAMITHSAVISNLKAYLTKEEYVSLSSCKLQYNSGELKIVDFEKNKGSQLNLNNKFLFVRHAENIYDEKLSNNDLNLSDNGVKQAIKGYKMLPEKFDIIISSPATRCKETALILSNYENNIIIDDRLYERGWGNNKLGNETQIEAKERILDFLLDVDNKYQNKKILVVTHGSLMKLIQDVIEQKYEDRQNIDNCTMIQYDKQKQKTIIKV